MGWKSALLPKLQRYKTRVSYRQDDEAILAQLTQVFRESCTVDGLIFQSTANRGEQIKKAHSSAVRSEK